MIEIALALVAAFLNATGSFYLKKVKLNIFNKNLHKCLVSFGTGLIFYIVALSFTDLLIIYPIAATQYIWIAFFGLRLGEKITKTRAVGIALIVIGVIIISLA